MNDIREKVLSVNGTHVISDKDFTTKGFEFKITIPKDMLGDDEQLDFTLDDISSQMRRIIKFKSQD